MISGECDCSERWSKLYKCDVSTERLGQCRVRYIVPQKSLEEIDGQMERSQIFDLFWTWDLCRD